jgi:hypothetical protein
MWMWVESVGDGGKAVRGSKRAETRPSASRRAPYFHYDPCPRAFPVVLELPPAVRSVVSSAVGCTMACRFVHSLAPASVNKEVMTGHGDHRSGHGSGKALAACGREVTVNISHLRRASAVAGRIICAAPLKQGISVGVRRAVQDNVKPARVEATPAL